MRLFTVISLKSLPAHHFLLQIDMLPELQAKRQAQPGKFDMRLTGTGALRQRAAWRQGEGVEQFGRPPHSGSSLDPGQRADGVRISVQALQPDDVPHLWVLKHQDQCVHLTVSAHSMLSEARPEQISRVTRR